MRVTTQEAVWKAAVWHAVIKPIYGAASIGVVRVNDMQQLEAAYKRVTRELACAHIVAGALQQGQDDDEGEQVDQALAAAQVSSPPHASSCCSFAFMSAAA